MNRLEKILQILSGNNSREIVFEEDGCSPKERYEFAKLINKLTPFVQSTYKFYVGPIHSSMLGERYWKKLEKQKKQKLGYIENSRR